VNYELETAKDGLVPGELWRSGCLEIVDTEAAQHVGQHITVEGVVAKVFRSKNGNTFLNLGGHILPRPLPEGETAGNF
jgi:hypothetical protein